jgi:predicted nucleic acid-binding protein
MKILFDTNILVHAYNKSSPHQQKAAKIVKEAMNGKTQACLTSQVLYEMFAVITNPKRVEKPLQPSEAADLCLDLWECSEIEKLTQSEITPLETFKFVKILKLRKAEIFDCALAVTAKENNVETIYTENIADFKRYEFLKVINPLKPE